MLGVNGRRALGGRSAKEAGRPAASRPALDVQATLAAVAAAKAKVRVAAAVTRRRPNCDGAIGEGEVLPRRPETFGISDPDNPGSKARFVSRRTMSDGDT